jgi:hypothetical protein
LPAGRRTEDKPNGEERRQKIRRGRNRRPPMEEWKTIEAREKAAKKTGDGRMENNESQKINQHRRPAMEK